MRKKKPGRKSVANAENLGYPFLTLTNIQTLRIRKLKPNPYFSDEDYISLEIPIDGI